MPTTTSRMAVFAMVLLVAAAACFNPVHSDAVAALGGETNGGPGPNHRPGQPCLTCHGGDGPGKPEFVFAGTVYSARNSPTAAQGVTVTLTDLYGTAKQLTTNRAGNFYLDAQSWSPAYPISVTLTPQSGKTVTMFTTIGRDGGCAFCHYGADNDQTHMPPVFLQ